MKNDRHEERCNCGVSYRVAEVHFVAGSLMGTCVKYVVQCLFGENIAKKDDELPLANNTAFCRINDMSINTETTDA
jgi:hypothetical protein